VLESDLDEKLQPLIPARSDIRLGLLASPLGVTVSLTAAGDGIDVEELDRIVQLVREAVGPALYAERFETMEEVVGRQLMARGLTIAVAESCTGGLIGHRLTQVPGSSAYLDRVVVCYSDRAKIELLGVPAEVMKRHGSVSAEVAERMAKGIREKSGTDVGLSVTGIAGPDGGTAQKPVGLVYVGLNAAAAGMTVQEFRFHGPRDVVKLRASQAALHLLRQWLPLVQRTRS
jgi:nicotinamide-nucleotide amidase